MIDINEAHKFVLRFLKKSYGSFVRPSDIDAAINSASIDLFNQQIKLFKESERVPELIKNFKRQTSGALTSGTLSISTEDIEVTAVQTVIGGRKHPAKIIDNDLKWISRSYSDMDMDVKTEKPLSIYLKEVEVTSNLQELPEDFICAEYAYVVESSTTNRYEAMVMTPERFESKRLLDVFPDLENPEVPPSHLNLKEETYTGAQINAGAALPKNFIKEISASVQISGRGSYEGVVVPADLFYSKQLLDLIGSRNKEEEMPYLTNKEESITVTSSQYNALPEDYVEFINIFYLDSGVYKEGEVLSDREFADRLNSEILAPTTEHPIARISGNSIEFSPKPPSGTYTYVLSYKAFPTIYRPVLKVEDDKLYIRPSIDNSDSVKLVYLEHPAEKRPIVRVVDNKAEIEPFNGSDYTYKLGYYQYPTPERALVRIVGDNSNEEVDVEVAPSSGVDSIIVYYFKKPDKGVFAYTSENGVITYNPSGSTDLDWDEKAFTPLMTQALMYLGFVSKDQDATTIGANRDQSIENKKQQ